MSRQRSVHGKFPVVSGGWWALFRVLLLGLSTVGSMQGAVAAEPQVAAPLVSTETGMSGEHGSTDLVLSLSLSGTGAAHVAPPASQTPAASAATVSLAAGDMVTVTVFGRPELTSTVYVSDRGQIDMPLAGLVDVAGLSPPEAAERVASAYKIGRFLVNPQVNVVLSGIRSQQISILGEVSKPGRYPIETRTTVLDGLALAGGITGNGDQRVFVIRRDSESGQEKRTEVDLRGIFESGDGAVPRLRAGDTVVVPRAKQFYIHGEVRNPNAYVLRPRLTVIEAISLAGGLTPLGSSRRIQIRRKSEGGNVQEFGADMDTPVMAEDVINVRERLF